MQREPAGHPVPPETFTRFDPVNVAPFMVTPFLPKGARLAKSKLG
jgi:hypothetical protein